MKIQCDVCERNPATVICCADEAALCGKCDVEVHAANKLASKHQRLQLHLLSSKLPSCDICQEKTAFIFCVEDRALFCQDCDESVHMTSTLAMNHQRYLATGIKVALGSHCVKETEIQYKEPPNLNGPQVGVKLHAMKPPSVKQPVQQLPSALPSPPWAVDDLLAFSEIAPPEKKGGPESGELDWWSQMNLFGEPTSREALAAAEVPEVRTSQPNSCAHQRPNKVMSVNKKPRIETREDDEEHFIVPDLG
ncbi:B-box zinc finger protein 24-like protein [Drosera capensis]